MKYTKQALILIAIFLIATFVYSATTDFARVECNRQGAGDDGTFWLLFFDAGSEIQIGPTSHIFLRVRRPSISDDDVAYNIVIRNNITGAEYAQIDWWQRMTSTDWFIWSPRFSGVDDTPSGTPINTTFLQPRISDWDDGSSATGYIYYDIDEIRLGETWETGTPIAMRDSSAGGTVANRWYHSSATNVNWIPRFAYYTSGSPDYATLGTKQMNNGGDNTNWWCTILVPTLPGNGTGTNYSLYLRYRLSPLSEEDLYIQVRGLDYSPSDFGFSGWFLITSTSWAVTEFPYPQTPNLAWIAIGVSDSNDGDSSTALLLLDIDRVVWAPQGYGTDIDAAAADPKATELPHRDYHPNTTAQELTDILYIWSANVVNLGYVKWLSEETDISDWTLF